MQLTVFICGIDMQFNIADKLAVLVSVKMTATSADLYEVKKYCKVWISQHRK